MENRFLSVMQSADSWAIFGIVGRLACIAGALLHWFGVIEITPYSLVSGLFASAISEFANNVPPLAMQLADWFLGGVFWLLVAVLWIEFVRYRVAVLEAGSKEVYRQQRREAAEKAAIPVPVGVLVSIATDKGGLLSSSETLVETSEGYFRVSGLVDSARKGEPVFTLHGYLLIGDRDGQRRFTRL